VQMYIERAGQSPLTGVSNSEGKGEKIVSDRLQQIRTIFYRKRP
jgi:type VI secretion system secreted protein VgrG